MKKPTAILTGARFGLMIFVIFSAAIGFYFRRTGIPAVVMAVIGAMLGGLAFWLLGLIIPFMIRGIRQIPEAFIVSMLAAIGCLYLIKSEFIRLPDSAFLWTAVIGAFSFILVTAGLWALIKKEVESFVGLVSVIGGIAIFAIGIFWWAEPGSDQYPIETFTQTTSFVPIDLDDPGENGEFEFSYFTYGSQNSDRRSIFNEEVKIVTPTVDATKLLPEWKGKKKKWRERFWGFGVDSFPLNGHVWMPLGEGPFPMILIVHGNHSMEHYSDPGYAYLGEHLASNGYITVSIDENFINGTWSGDFRGREMPTRAWLLLKHLELWRKWNTSEPIVQGLANLDQVILAGHSRGGEAVAIAAAYNKLKAFPDDASEVFDFNFGIKGIVTIAPTDKRYFRRMDLENIHYMTLQGSYDSDEASFFGHRIAQRIRYTDSIRYVNANMLIHRANHGQFNSIWGNMDFGKPYGWLLNTGALMSGEDQRQMAKVFIHGFARAVSGEPSDLSAFRDIRHFEPFLPKSPVICNYRDSKQELIVDFEDDIDVFSAGEHGIEGSGMKVWKEEKLRFRDQDFQGNNAVVLGWNHKDTSVVRADEPFYTIHLKDFRPLGMDPEYFRFDLCIGSNDAVKIKDDKSNKKKKPNDKEKPEIQPLNFTITLRDSFGSSMSLPINDFQIPSPQFKIGFMKSKEFATNLGLTWEPALESFYVPIDRFGPGNIDFAKLAEIIFAFDQTELGVIYLDNIGLAW